MQNKEFEKILDKKNAYALRFEAELKIQALNGKSELNKVAEEAYTLSHDFLFNSNSDIYVLADLRTAKTDLAFFMANIRAEEQIKRYRELPEEEELREAVMTLNKALTALDDGENLLEVFF